MIFFCKKCLEEGHLTKITSTICATCGSYVEKLTKEQVIRHTLELQRKISDIKEELLESCSNS